MKKIMMMLSTLLLIISLAMPVFASEQTDDPVEFPFTVILRDNEGNELEGEFEYSGTKSGTIRSGDVIYLGDKDYIDILNLPEGTLYEVTEGETEGWELESSTNTTGSIVDQELSHAKFVNQQLLLGPRLPETGGPGPWAFTATGSLLLAAAAIVLLQRKRKYQ